MNEPRSWVVARLSALGDVTLTTGVLDYWRRTRGWTFTVLTREAFSPVFQGHPAVRAVETLASEDLRLPRLVARFRELAESHRGEGLLDLHGTPRTRLLSLLWKGRVRRFPKLSLRRRLFLACGGRFFGNSLRRWNVPQRYALAVEHTAPARGELLPRLFLSASERERAAALLASLAPAAPLVALHPYATHMYKAWPAECWRELAEGLEARGAPWFVIGRGQSPFDARPNDLSNRTDLRETCALLAEADLLVTGDSGPMHLAAGVGTPVVALFGPTCEEWGFFPQGPGDRVLQADLPCRPCSLHGKRGCGQGPGCMRHIRVEQVLDAALSIERKNFKT